MTPKDLENAVLFKDIDKIKLARQEGLNANNLSMTGNSLLHTAILDGKEDNIIPVLEELIKFPQIDLDKKNASFSYSPLVSALFSKKYLVAEFLIKNGANIEIEDSTGNTPLMNAVLGGEKEKVDFLLKYPVTLNHENKDGATPVFFCARKNIGLSELIERGADLMHVSSNKNCIAYHLSLNPDRKTTITVAKEIEKIGKIPQFKMQIEEIISMYETDSIKYPDKDMSKSIANINYIKSIVNSIDLHQKLNNDTEDKIITKKNKI